jgi:radical SAM superfamily enzyme YgiQ (UPF0313 family)
MKIILCYPPKRNYPGYGQEKRWLPLGIASLGAYIKREFPEINIVLLDLFDYTPNAAKEEIIKNIDKTQINIIGYTCFTEQRFSVWELAEAIKLDSILFNLNIVNVVGGAHAFLAADQIIRHYSSFIDVVIKGEGEKAWEKLINDIYSGDAWKGIYESENIQDLDSLPHSIDGFDLFANVPKEIEAEAPIVFSRGCTDYCSFCSTTKFWKGYRSRTAENVFQEMLKYYSRYGTKKFKFHDDASTADIENWKKLCRKIIDFHKNIIENSGRNPSWEYEITARADQFDDELIDLLSLSGCKKVALGIESGNEALRKAMNKNLNIELAKVNMKKLMTAGIEVVMLFIVGYPGESDETIQETIDLIREVKPSSFCTQPLMIFPGTKVYRDCVKWGWINDDYWLKDMPQPYYLREQTWQKINQWVATLQNCTRKINVLLAVPARQKEEIFELFMQALNNLKVPDNVNLVRFFVLHNSPNLEKYLCVTDQCQKIETNDEYVTDKDTHHWRQANLQFIKDIKNQIADIVVKNGFDYVFFIDSDLIVQTQTLETLLKANKPIVSEIFWTAWNEGRKMEPNAWDFDHYGFIDGTMEKYKKPGLYMCGGTGACILISRKVFEAGVNYNPIPNVSFWGEDRAFSIRANVAGFPLFVDTTCEATHLYRDSDLQKFKEKYKSS